MAHHENVSENIMMEAQILCRALSLHKIVFRRMQAYRKWLTDCHSFLNRCFQDVSCRTHDGVNIIRWHFSQLTVVSSA